MGSWKWPYRPFSIPSDSAHLGFSKLALCPFCGKWKLVWIEPIGKLRETEKAELELTQPVQSIGNPETEKTLKEIEDSKYQGL
jgi:hypothetical protein